MIKKISPGARYRTRTYEKTTARSDYKRQKSCLSSCAVMRCEETIKKISPGARYRTRTYEKSDRKERLQAAAKLPIVLCGHVLSTEYKKDIFL